MQEKKEKKQNPSQIKTTAHPGIDSVLFSRDYSVKGQIVTTMGAV